MLSTVCPVKGAVFVYTLQAVGNITIMSALANNMVTLALSCNLLIFRLKLELWVILRYGQCC